METTQGATVIPNFEYQITESDMDIIRLRRRFKIVLDDLFDIITTVICDEFIDCNTYREARDNICKKLSDYITNMKDSGLFNESDNFSISIINTVLDSVFIDLERQSTSDCPSSIKMIAEQSLSYLDSEKKKSELFHIIKERLRIIKNDVFKVGACPLSDNLKGLEY